MNITSFDPSTYPNLISELIDGLHLCHMQNIGKEKILLIHGGQASASYFYPIMQELYNKGFEPWALDLRGHGESNPVDLKDVHFWDYTEDVKKALSISQAPFLLGHSMGGFISQKVASQIPLKGLILLCSMPPNVIKVKLSKKYYIFLYAIISLPYVLFRKKSPFKKLLTKRYAYTKTDPEIFELLQKERKRVRSLFPKTKGKKFYSETPHLTSDLKSEYGKIVPTDISCKMKIIGGKYDLIISEKTEIKLSHYYNVNKNNFVILPNSSHTPVVEDDRNILVNEIITFIVDNK